MRLPALLLLTTSIALAACEGGPVAVAPHAASLDGPVFNHSANGAPVRANGQGILALSSLRTFAFNAVQQRDGSVEGHTTLQNHTADIRIHTRIECLSVQGNRAVLTGYITESTIEGYPGRYTLVVVEDNGEGNAVDRMSLQYVYPPGVNFSCQGVPATGFPMIPVEKGNIQVAP